MQSKDGITFIYVHYMMFDDYHQQNKNRLVLSNRLNVISLILVQYL